MCIRDSSITKEGWFVQACDAGPGGRDGAAVHISKDKGKTWTCLLYTSANPVANVAQALQGQLPGVSVTSQDGRPGAGMSSRIRGGGSITQSNDPLFIVMCIRDSFTTFPFVIGNINGNT